MGIKSIKSDICPNLQQNATFCLQKKLVFFHEKLYLIFSLTLLMVIFLPLTNSYTKNYLNLSGVMSNNAKN